MRIIKVTQQKQGKYLQKEAIAFDAIDLHSFEDRNRLNKRIREFKEIAQTFAYLRKYIFQNAPHAQTIIGSYIKDKRMSSYPEIIELMELAYKKSRDNYEEFANICNAILQKLYKEIENMEKVKKQFVREIMPKRMRERMRKHE